MAKVNELQVTVLNLENLVCFKNEYPFKAVK